MPKALPPLGRAQHQPAYSLQILCRKSFSIRKAHWFDGLFQTNQWFHSFVQLGFINKPLDKILRVRKKNWQRHLQHLTLHLKVSATTAQTDHPQNGNTPSALKKKMLQNDSVIRIREKLYQVMTTSLKQSCETTLKNWWEKPGETSVCVFTAPSPLWGVQCPWCFPGPHAPAAFAPMPPDRIVRCGHGPPHQETTSYMWLSAFLQSLPSQPARWVLSWRAGASCCTSACVFWRLKNPWVVPWSKHDYECRSSCGSLSDCNHL